MTMKYKFGCSTIQMLANVYFKNPDRLCTELKDEIITHIISCDSCRKTYQDYARAYGVKFNPDEEIEKIMKAYDNEEEKIRKARKEEAFPYFNAAKRKEYDKLLGVKSVRDYMIQGQYDETIKNDRVQGKDYDFAWFIIRRLCKNVDDLEALYKLSGGKEDEKLQ